MGQTVNLLAYAFGGSNPSLPTTKKGGNVVETYLKQHYRLFFKSAKAEVAQLVEHQPSKLRVAGSNLVFRSIELMLV